MKALPLQLIDGLFIPCSCDDATHIKLLMPIPEPLRIRIIPVQIKGKREGTPNWTWNGDTERPTLRPSILTAFEYGIDNKKIRCHSWVTDGFVQFLSDCSHELAGQTLELLDIQVD